MLLVTGGAGFIGSNFVHYCCTELNEKVVVVDKLSYAGNLLNLDLLKNTGKMFFIEADICDKMRMAEIFETYQPRWVINFAAETHVDRSIVCPQNFIDSNILGVASLLEVSRVFWDKMPADKKHKFRFLQISTDEVYGSLEQEAPPANENNKYYPNNPYSASKAAGDHLVRAYHQTYGLPVLTTNCSNNYGPYQHPEKFIPMLISNALSGKKLPIYGTGENIRDWLYVKDHCLAIKKVLDFGELGSSYNIGGHSELTNIEVAKIICRNLDELFPKPEGSYLEQLVFVEDRRGHDQRYSIDTGKIFRDLEWRPMYKFDDGIILTINWYSNNSSWHKSLKSDSYINWMNSHYQEVVL